MLDPIQICHFDAILKSIAWTFQGRQHKKIWWNYKDENPELTSFAFRLRLLDVEVCGTHSCMFDIDPAEITEFQRNQFSEGRPSKIFFTLNFFIGSWFPQ